MTNKELEKLLKNAGLTPKLAGKLIGVSLRDMSLYAAGVKPVPKTVEYALRYVVQNNMHLDLL